MGKQSRGGRQSVKFVRCAARPTQQDSPPTSYQLLTTPILAVPAPRILSLSLIYVHPGILLGSGLDVCMCASVWVGESY